MWFCVVCHRLTAISIFNEQNDDEAEREQRRNISARSDLNQSLDAGVHEVQLKECIEIFNKQVTTTK